MPLLLEQGSIDAALGGLDDLLEGGMGFEEPRVRTRILESTVVVVCLDGHTAAATRYVSQMPVAARALGFAGKHLQPIHGRAETWLHLRGDGYAAIDTLHTGSHAAQAGLRVIAVIGQTAIQIAHRPGISVPPEWLAAWPTYAEDLQPATRVGLCS